MTPSPVTIDATAGCTQALALMQEHAIQHLPVTDAEGRVAGIVTERDLLLSALQSKRAKQNVEQLMHRGVVTVRDDAPIAHAATLMVDTIYAALPVLDRKGRMIGVITQADLFRAFVGLIQARPARREAAVANDASAKLPAEAPATRKVPARP